VSCEAPWEDDDDREIVHTIRGNIASARFTMAASDGDKDLKPVGVYSTCVILSGNDESGWQPVATSKARVNDDGTFEHPFHDENFTQQTVDDAKKYKAQIGFSPTIGYGKELNHSFYLGVTYVDNGVAWNPNGEYIAIGGAMAKNASVGYDVFTGQRLHKWFGTELQYNYIGKGETYVYDVNIVDNRANPDRITVKDEEGNIVQDIDPNPPSKSEPEEDDDPEPM
jgi:hypothetical protein